LRKARIGGLYNLLGFEPRRMDASVVREDESFLTGQFGRGKHTVGSSPMQHSSARIWPGPYFGPLNPTRSYPWYRWAYAVQQRQALSLDRFIFRTDYTSPKRFFCLLSSTFF
jgi:hypothetical protein